MDVERYLNGISTYWHNHALELGRDARVDTAHVGCLIMWAPTGSPCRVLHLLFLPHRLFLASLQRAASRRLACKVETLTRKTHHTYPGTTGTFESTKIESQQVQITFRTAWFSDEFCIYVHMLVL